jgi:hypothetical protein
MTKRIWLAMWLWGWIGAMGASNLVEACTNFLITQGASGDGSTMISYSADSIADPPNRNPKVEWLGYSEGWYRRIVEERGEHFRGPNE